MGDFADPHEFRFDDIISALEVIQTRGGNGNFVIFEADPVRNYYIQFSCAKGDTDLYGEAVANHVIKPEFQIPVDRIAVLIELGWEDQGSDMNYGQSFSARDDHERLTIAKVVWKTFQKVYGILTDVELMIQTNLE